MIRNDNSGERQKKPRASRRKRKAPADPVVALREELSERERLFADYYLGAANLNGSRAARLAGYSNAAVEAHRLLNDRPHVRAYVNARLETMGMGESEIVYRLTLQARGSMEPFLYGQETDNLVDDELVPSGKLDLMTPAAREHAHLIKEATQVTVDFDGGRRVTNKIKLHDPQAALIALSRIYGMTKPDADERLLGLVDMASLSDEQIARVAAGESLLQVLLAGQRSDDASALPPPTEEPQDEAANV